MQTRAGNRDWSDYIGRLFCNACFTQFATKGFFERLGRASEHNSKRPRPAANSMPAADAAAVAAVAAAAAAATTAATAAATIDPATAVAEPAEVRVSFGGFC